MSDEASLPLQAIVLHAVCELRDALAYFQKHKKEIPQPDGFPDKWSMSIQLTPKVNTDFNGRVGWTGTSKGPGSTPAYFNNWTVGSSPGAGVDVKAFKNGAATYYVSADALLNPKRPLLCHAANDVPHALAQDFGIRPWLERLLLSATQDNYNLAVDLDKPTFGAEIDIRSDAAGSFTYNFPLGTNFGSLGGYYETDQILAISFTPPVRVISQFPALVTPARAPRKQPRRDQFIQRFEFDTIAPKPPLRVAPAKPAASPSQSVPESTRQRLDSIQLENTLRNLQFNR